MIDFFLKVWLKVVIYFFPEGIPLRKGWRMRFWWIPNEGIAFRAYNPMLKAKGVDEAFFVVDNSIHPYGAPFFIEETSLGIKFEVNDIQDRLVGIVIEDLDGNVQVQNDGSSKRFSFSNLVNQGRVYLIDIDNRVYIDDEPQGFIRTVYNCNKNRVRGWIAGVSPQKGSIVIKELEDIRLTKL
jgi:hypothetical protein